MQNPSTEPQSVPMDQTQDLAPVVADAGIQEQTATTEVPSPEAEVEVEEIMSEGIEEEQENLRAGITEETILSDAKALLEKDAAEISGDEIRRLKQQFSMIHKKPEAAEGEESEAAVDEAKAEFDAVIEQIKEKKAAWAAEQDAIRAANLARKNEIIEQIKALAEDTDNVNRTFQQYRELQDAFNAVGDVDPTEETGVWKRFQEAREHYSDNLKINKELRDYDFKKNLSEKEALLSEARALAGIDDIISAYRQLQDLHNKWRQVGPVAKELRDQIWADFREASAEVNKKYQAFFEARKEREAQNEAEKNTLCQQVEEIDLTSLKTFNAWEETTKRIQEIQEEWRKIGFAAKKVNHQLFQRFRAACDKFFAAKAEFYRNTREELATNLARKQALADKAESLKESTDWRKTTDEFIEMQKEWKTIGAIPKKYSDDLWKRFTAACDAFFDAKKKAGSGARQSENANLRAKREIIGLLSALAENAEAAKDDAMAQLHSLQDRWKEVGHVPFREKDKLYEAYRAACDAVRDKFAVARTKARRERFEASVAQIETDENKLFRERERLARALENRRNDLRTYENNLGFLSSKSKNGNSLMHDLQRRIEALKADIEDIEAKIAIIDQKLG